MPTELVLTTLLNELAAAPDEVWLVLDDYHLVDNHEINEGMAFLLEHLPAQVHVVISTRADPDLPLARWRVRGELVEIRAADLRFTSDEANAYLNVATGLELAAADIAVLEERTEGWIAALQLAALSLQGRQDVSGFIARFAGDDRYIVDYLIEEVLRHQSAAVRDFLLQSAVLDRLTGPLCDAVTGRDDGSEMLVTLERANLFIVALDDRREWYRYHHLFADVLRARMLSEQPDQVSLLHQRASQLVRAPRSDRGGDPARTGGPGLRPGGPPDRAGHAGDPTPPAGSADVRLAEGAARRHRPAQPGAECLLRRHADALRRPRRGRAPARRRGTRAGGRPRRRRLSHGRTPTELRTLPATIAIYRASLAQARGDAAGTAAHARRALDLAGADDHLARGGAAGFLGLAAWAAGRRVQRLGDVRAGGGQPARRRQPRRRAERHGRAR